MNANNAESSLIVKQFGRMDYAPIFESMKQFTLERSEATPDELWLLEHNPVYTQGQAGKPWHILGPMNYPLVQSDRGGQVTFHGPGQLMAYCLLHLSRWNLNIRSLVTVLENSVLQLLKQHGIEGETICDAPGVYVNGSKIASIGLRVKQGNSYHGLCFNIDNDLSPFEVINPCGYQQLKMTNLSLLTPHYDKAALPLQLADCIKEQLIIANEKEASYGYRSK